MEEVINNEFELFILDSGPIYFYLGEGFEDIEDVYCRWLDKIELYGGKVVHIPTDETVNLIDPKFIYDIREFKQFKRYDCRFVSDSFKQNALQNLENYQIQFNPWFDPKWKQETPVFQLNNLCLAEIFLRLPKEERLKMEQVCKKWKDASSLAWNDIKQLNYDFNDNGYSECPDLFNEIKTMLNRCGKYLTNLQISQVCSSKIIPVIKKNCTKIVSLQLLMTEYREQDCIEIFSTMTKLESLSIQLGETEIISLPKSLIKSLDGIADSIRELDLSAGVSFNDSERAFLFPSDYKIPRFKNLHSLKITEFDLRPGRLQEIIQKNPDLKLLHLEADIINDSCLNSILDLKYLEDLCLFELELEQCIDDIFCGQLARYCKKLKRLRLGSYVVVKDGGIIELAKLENLEVLDLDCCHPHEHITDYSMKFLPPLKRLRIRGCINISDEGIITVLKKSPNLELLDASRTELSFKTILYADNITMYRTNNIVLIISVYHRDLPTSIFTQCRLKSPYLKIVGPQMRFFY